jgi:ABC-2 type transport system ATP-binding protein
MIEVCELRKRYGELTAVDGISFTATEGRVFGLLGPNGAGKSTTIGCISGLLKPSSGHVKVLGHDVQRAPRAARQTLGVVPQELALYEDLSARENLDFWGAAYGLTGAERKRRVDEVLESVGLYDRAEEPSKQFSGGMKRRLNFGCGIVHQPKVLLLDEPTVGVDPQSRERLLELVREQLGSGTCVLYTTHYMQEAELLCDELAIIDHGHVVASGSLDELRGQMGEKDLLRIKGQFDVPAIEGIFGQDPGIELISASQDTLQLAMTMAGSQLPMVFERIAGASGQVRETTVTRPSLESLFIKLTGRELRDG